MAAETIETLLDSWVNGNRSHVVGMFGHASRGEVTEFVVALVRNVGIGDAETFGRMLKNRE